MSIARVFPTRTSLTPTDENAYYDVPDLFTPNYDEVHISVTFTWDIKKVERLRNEWSRKGKVIVGGVAIDGESVEPFKAGMYLKNGVTITSRGCPNSCSFCQVNKGRLIEFDEFPEGNIVNDNNILATSDRHWDLVISMLKKQRRIEFMGGLEARRLTVKRMDDIRGLKIHRLFFACDSHGAIKSLEKIAPMLNGFHRNKLQCYVLCGKDIGEETERLERVYDLGFLPFAQLYRDRDNSIQYSKEWKQFARRWSRPAIIKSMMKRESENNRRVGTGIISTVASDTKH